MDCSRILEEDLANIRMNSRGFADRKGKKPMGYGKRTTGITRSLVVGKGLVGEILVLQSSARSVVKWGIAFRNARVLIRSV